MQMVDFPQSFAADFKYFHTLGGDFLGWVSIQEFTSVF